MDFPRETEILEVRTIDFCKVVSETIQTVSLWMEINTHIEMHPMAGIICVLFVVSQSI